MKPPAFQFYADDFLGGTCDMRADEVGAYMRLLCYQWNRGCIPIDDREKLERITGCEVSNDVLMKFPDGKNRRMESERAKQSAYRENQRKKGVASAKARFNRGSTVVQPSAADSRLEPKVNSPSPSPKTETIRPKGFAEFWEAYPRGDKKVEAAKSFAKAGVDIAIMLDALAWFKSTPEWKRDGGKYIPHAVTWLNQRRWEDCVSIKQNPQNDHGMTPEELAEWEAANARLVAETDAETLRLIYEK